MDTLSCTPHVPVPRLTFRPPHSASDANLDTALWLSRLSGQRFRASHHPWGRIRVMVSCRPKTCQTAPGQHLPLLPVNLSSDRGHAHHTCSDSPGPAPGHVQKQVPELGPATPGQPVPASETADSLVCSICTGIWLISAQKYHVWSSPSPSRLFQSALSLSPFP